MMTEINDKGESVGEKEQDELADLVGELSATASVVIMSGSLPSGVADDYYFRLSERIPKNVKKIFDVTGDRLVNALKGGAYLVKPNLDELREITGEHYDGFDEMLGGCRRLLDAGAENVMLSLGRKGTVGAGDGMVAATALMTERGETKEEILRCAVAAGTASVTTPGTNLFYKDKFLEIYDRIKVEKVY